MNKKITLLLIIVLIGNVYAQGQQNKASQSFYSMKLINQIKNTLFEKIVPDELMKIQDTEFQFKKIKCLVKNAVLHVPKNSIHLSAQNGEVSILAQDLKFQFEATFSNPSSILNETIQGELIFSQNMTPQITLINNYTNIFGFDIKNQTIKKQDYGNVELFYKNNKTCKFVEKTQRTKGYNQTDLYLDKINLCENSKKNFTLLKQQFKNSINEYLEIQLRAQIQNIAEVINSMLQYQTQDLQYGNLTSHLSCKIDQSFVVRDVKEEYVVVDHGYYGWNSKSSVKKSPSFDNLIQFPQVDSEIFNENKYIQYFNEYYFNSISNALFEAGTFEQDFNQQQILKYDEVIINFIEPLRIIQKQIKENKDLKLKFKVLERPNFKIQNNQISSLWSSSIILFDEKDNTFTVHKSFDLSLKIYFQPKLVEKNQAFKLEVGRVEIEGFPTSGTLQYFRSVANDKAKQIFSDLSNMHFFKEETKINSEYFVLEQARISIEGDIIKIEGDTQRLCYFRYYIQISLLLLIIIIIHVKHINQKINLKVKI